jgi:hypothetical protein
MSDVHGTLRKPSVPVIILGNPHHYWKFSRIIGHGKTSDCDASRTIGVFMKSVQTGTISANNAIGRTVGKPMEAIKAQQI